MKCTNCGTDFSGDICPNCQKPAAGWTNEVPMSGMQQQSENATRTPAFNLPTPKPMKPKRKLSIRMIFEIVGGVLLIVFVITTLVFKTDYNKLKDRYNELMITNADNKSKVSELIADLTETKSEYGDYKARMKPYEGLEESEAKAKKIEAEKKVAEKEKADADKKAADEKAAADKKAAEDKAAADADAKRKAAESASLEQKNALSKAMDYLSYTAFSYSGLIQQLEYEGFSKESATYGADNCGADWNEQAAKKAEDYMKFTSFSRDSLIQQLEYEGFTPEQAAHGADSVGY